MSKPNHSDKEVKSTEENQEKVMTKYDLKVQKRKEEKQKEERDKKFGTALGILIVAALVCLVASFPIRSFLTVNGTYVTVGGEKVSRVEFDYFYNLAKSNFLSQNGTWLYYMGIDVTGDVTSAMYSEDMTFGDYFQELAVENITQNKALSKEGREAGFVYDTAEEYNEYLEALKQYASDNGATVKAYLKDLYGVYATESRLKPSVQEVMYANAYYKSVLETLIPSQDEIQKYYEENKRDYDSVDYRIDTVDAEMPTASAEPAQTTAPAEGSQSGDSAAYQPTEEETAAAMAAAKAIADLMEKTVKTEGEQVTNASRYDTHYKLRDWLFDDERKAGDTTVIEDTTSNRYYVLAFEKRYLNHAQAANLRVVMTREGNGQAILDEWKGGAADEASFAELCGKYNDPELDLEGGLLEDLVRDSAPEELENWIFDSQRKNGDAAVIAPEGDEYAYVLYYVGPGREEWVISIEDTLQGNKATEYLDKLTADVKVEDKKGRLNYLKIYAAREAAAADEQKDGTSPESSGEPSSEPSSGQ